ncbi:MAG: dTDP-4-dehydrorhamnose 3,5-epimerase family protein [Bacteroidota bacterium]|nr:dTDP-4-dehydrorhamnose 3,5-epimerase family protein [Bacteroidota bacterium]
MSFPRWTLGNINGCRLQPLKNFSDARGWLAEIYREDELADFLHPVMAYVSMTHAGIARGPHAHDSQTDLFAFFSGSFRLYLWDNRPDSHTYGHRTTVDVGETNPVTVLIPPGVIHAYRNTGSTEAIVLNCPNRLYAGHHRQEPVDEIRYEDLNNPELMLD